MSSGADELPAGEQFIDGTNILWAKLLSAIGGAWILVWSNGYLLVLDTIVGVHVWAIHGIGDFAARFVGLVLGAPAAATTQAWATAFAEAAQHGPLAPLLLTLDAIVVLLVVTAILDRRPYR